MERLTGSVLDALSQPDVEDILTGSESTTTEEVAVAICEARQHAADAAGLLTKGIGDLATYRVAITTAPETAAAAHGTMPVGTSVTEHTAWRTPESSQNTTPQPEHTLEFSPEEFQALIPDIKKFKVVKTGKIYEIPGHPDKLLRVMPMSAYTNDKLATPEQNREHMRLYEAELARLHAAGIPLLRRATYIHDSPVRSRSMLYTVVERHPAAQTMQKLANERQGNADHAGALYNERVIIEKTIAALRTYHHNSHGTVISDLHYGQITANDGTLLDYDAYLSVGDEIGYLLDEANQLAACMQKPTGAAYI